MKARCQCGNPAAHPLFKDRRTVLQWAGLASLGLLAGLVGCDGGSGNQAKTPTEIGPGTACHLDGMLLADYPGPKAQILVAGRAEPMFFCDTTELFNTLLAGEQALKIEGVYVQDMGRAEWERPQGYWIDARQGFYVLGSKRHGSMGPTIASFAQEADAQRHAKDYGGKVLPFAGITKDMVDLSGGVLQDKHM